MKDLRKYIQENRSAFDDKEPPMGHMERFEALLKKQEEKKKDLRKPTKRIKFITLISVAAMFAILVGVAVKFYAPQSINVEPSIENGVSDEFLATNEYYSQLMEEQIADIMCKLSNTDSENQGKLTEDLQQIVEENKNFINEMSQNENKEIAIRYLVKHYKTNIEALENINEKLGKHVQC